MESVDEVGGPAAQHRQNINQNHNTMKIVGVVIELVVAYLQFVSIALGNNKNESFFPKEWSNPMHYVSLMNLNVNIVGNIITALRDTRTYFMVISVIIPLCIILVGLLSLSKKRVVLWYFATLTGLMLFCCGIFVKVSKTDKSNTDAIILMSTGGGILLLCLVLMVLGYKGYLGNLSDDSDIKLDKKELRKRETENISRCRSFQRFCYFIFPFSIGMAVFPWSRIDGFSILVAVVLFIIAFFFFVWMMMGFTRRGREIQWNVNEACISVFLKMLVLIISTMYMPIGTTVFLIFNCRNFSCPKGYRLPDDRSLVVLDKSSEYPNCIPCAIEPGQSCPSGVMGSVCDGNYGDRFGNDVSLSCQGIQTYFWPAAGLVTVMYLIGVPLLFYRLITVGGNLLKTHFPIEEPIRNVGEDDEKFEARRWAAKVRHSNNSAVFLFEPFHYKSRFCRLFQILQKLIIVGTSLYVVGSGLVTTKVIAVSSSLGVHFIVTILLFIANPFIASVTNRIAKLMSITLVLMCAVAIVVLYKSVPRWLLVLVMVVNFAVPIISIVVVVVEHCMDRRREENLIKVGENIRRVSVCLMGELDSEGRSVKVNSRRNSKMLDNIKEEAKIMRQKQEDVDRHINRTLQNIIRKHLMIAGVLGVLALGGCILGLWARETDVLDIPIERSRHGTYGMPTTVQLGGYESWDTFTSHCCCSVNKHNVERYPIVERWYCDNNKIVERPRMENIVGGVRRVNNGTYVRGTCKTSFDNNCSLHYDNFGYVTIDCPVSYDSVRNPTGRDYSQAMELW